MNVRDLLLSAIESLGQHKLRTLLTLCGVTLGTLLLFVSISGGLGVIRVVNQRLGIDERLMEISVRSGVLIDEVTVDDAMAAGITQEMSDERRIRLAKASGFGKRKNVTLNMKAVEQIQQLDHVKAVWPSYRVRASALVENSPRWIGRTINSVAPNKDIERFLIAGKGFSSEDAHEVIVGEVMLYALGIQNDSDLEAAIGSKIKLVPGSAELWAKANQLIALDVNQFAIKHGAKTELEDQAASDDNSAKDNSAEVSKLENEIALELERLEQPPLEFSIVGIMRTPTRDEYRLHPWLGRIATRIVLPQETAGEIWRKHNHDHLETRSLNAIVRVDSAEKAGPLERKIGDQGFLTTSFSKLAMQIRTAVLLVTLIIGSLAIGALLISGIGITNTMIMNVMERRREIAILKSIGAQDIDIKNMFLFEGCLIGIVGGLLGLLLGLVFSSITSHTIGSILESQLREPFGDNVFAYPWWIIVLTPIVATLVTTIASVIPARQAAKVEPVAALRAL